MTMIRDPTGCLRSSWRKERKLAVSAGLIVLQPMPPLLGYSQLCKTQLLFSFRREVLGPQLTQSRHRRVGISPRSRSQFSRRQSYLLGLRQRWRRSANQSNRQQKSRLLRSTMTATCMVRWEVGAPVGDHVRGDGLPEQIQGGRWAPSPRD